VTQGAPTGLSGPTGVAGGPAPCAVGPPLDHKMLGPAWRRVGEGGLGLRAGRCPPCTWHLGQGGEEKASCSWKHLVCKGNSSSGYACKGTLLEMQN